MESSVVSGSGAVRPPSPSSSREKRIPVIPREVAESTHPLPVIPLLAIEWIPRLRFAPRGMTACAIRFARNPSGPRSNRGKTWIAILALILLLSTAWAQAETGPPGPTWRERFLKDYPAAQRRLRDAVARAEGQGRYLRSDDPANQNAKSRDEMKWGEFRFVTQGDSLRLDLTLAGGGTAPNESLVLSPRFNFRVLGPNTQNAQMAHVSTEVEGRLFVSHARYWRDFFPACYLHAEATLDEWMKRPGFRMEGVEPVADADGRELVRIRYRWDGVEWFPRQHPPPADYEFAGEWLLSPAEDWAIRRTEYRESYSHEKDGNRERLLESAIGIVDVRHVDDLGFVPQRVESTTSRSTTDWSELLEAHVMICEFQNVRRSTAGGDVFTPEALGVPDPRGINWRLIGVNVGILLLLLAAWLGWRWRRR